MNPDILFYIAIPWNGLLTVGVLHIVLSRSGLMDFLRSLSWAVGLGTLFVVAVQGFVALAVRPLQFADALSYFVINLITYGALLYIYVNFVNMGETARRIRILRELSDAPDGLTRDELLSRYNAREIVATRLERLAVTGQIADAGQGRWRAVPGSVLLRVARFVFGMKVFFLGVPRGRS